MKVAQPETRGSVRLRGREAELARLQELVDELSAGRGAVALVEGAAGSGKTSLLGDIALRAERAGIRVCRGAGDPAAEMMPFSPLMDALLSSPEPLLDVGVMREIAGLPDPRFWLMQELQDGLERAALDGPVVIVMDDLQWADAATLLALRTLPARLSSHAILWLLAVRPGGAAVTVSALRAGGVVTLELSPLDDEAVTAVCEDVLGAVPDDAVVELVGDVEGSPFFLVELLRGLQEEGMITREGGRARLVGRRLPARFRDSVLARLEQLSRTARDAAQMAAVLGRRFSVAQIAMVLRRPEPSLLSPLGELLESGLLVEHGDRLEFRHDLVRDAVDAALPATMRHALRREAVALMLASGAPDAELAPLLFVAAEPGDGAAIGVLRRASAEIAATTPGLAATLSRRALDLTPQDSNERPEVIAETIPLLFGAGRLEEARGLADNALQGLLPPEAEARVRLGLAQVCVQHSFPEVVRQCRQALALDGVSPELRLHMRVFLTLGFLMNGDFEDALAVMDEDLAMARSLDDRAAEVAALRSCSAVSLHRQRWADAISYADEADAVAAAAGPQLPRLWPDVWSAWLRGVVGRPEEALEWLEKGLRAAQRDGRAAEARWWTMARARVLLTAGRLEEARAEAEAVLAMVDELGPAGAALIGSSYTLAAVACRTGDRAALRDAADGAAVMQASDSLLMRRSGAWTAALLADASGDPARAIELMRDTCGALGSLTAVFSSPQDPVDIMALLRMALRAGNSGCAEAVVCEAERRAGLNPGFELPAFLASHARGLLERDAAAMRTTVAALGAVQSPIARADVLEDVAGILQEVDRREAIAHLDAALELYAAAGAERDAARVRQRLRDLGERRRRLRRHMPRSGWSGLSDSELAVVALVAEGATNRQVAEELYLSPHTVSSHLRHAFDKLRIHSRVELAAMWAMQEAEQRAGDGRYEPSP